MSSGAILRPFACSLLVLVFSAWPSVAQAATKPEPVILQLPYAHPFQFAGVRAAVERGYFAEEGLEVVLQEGTVERQPSPEVAAGRAHYGIGQAEVLVDRLNGSPLVAVAVIFQHSPFAIMVRQDSGLATPADLSGRRIAKSPYGRYTEMRAMFAVEGLQPGQFQVVADRWPQNELVTGEADVISIFIADQPFEATRLGLQYRVIRPVDYGVDFYGDTLFTNETELREQPERVAAMRRALMRGWDHALAHPEELIDRMLPEQDRADAVARDRWRYAARAVARLVNADLVEIGHMNPGRWLRMAELVVKMGDAPSVAGLQGFIYNPAEDRSSGWIRWLGIGLVIAVLAVLLAILANRRLQLLVRRRTQELEVAEQRQRDYFELAPAPILIEDYTAFDAVLAGFHAEGVTDLRAHLRARPELVRELIRKKRIVAANRIALARSGFATVAAFDAGLPEIMTPETYDAFVEELVALWLGVDRLTLERSYQTKHGETIDSILNWEVSRKDGLRDLANVRLVFTDVTEQKRAEQKLRQSEERYRELFEQAVGGIYRSSPEGHFLSVNPALARILGFSQPEAMMAWSGGDTTPALYAKPGRREEFIAALNTRGQLSDFESEVHHRGGGTVWVSENARAVRDEAGRLLYYEGFVTDISARRQLESEIGRASKLEAVGILAGGIAHDFNNILTVVLGNVTLAESDTDPSSPVSARLLEAKRATLRARDLTLQLLTFAKGGEPVRTTIDLPELLREAAGFALHGAKARGEFQLARGLWQVNADKGQVGQMVQNLVINAVQAMPGGGVVTISAGNIELTRASDGAPPLPPGRYVQLTVADTGVGIAQEHLAKIFDPYFTTKEQGSGLGLATVYSIVRKHEGRIVVESEPGQGTVFRIWFPAVAAAAADPATGATGSPSPFQARVLFMDDEPAIRAMAILFMERIGCACEVVADGAEAVRKYQEALAAGRKYEVVVMDLTVPGGMGGREAMEHLLRLDPGVYAIVSSGYSRDPVLANYQAHGFQAVLPKPYGLDQLTNVMRAALDGPGNLT